ncbi:MAG: filamentous hemagglutinin N-terminal domain-containing protein [Cyanobacteria bacterium P01_G01_bin.19]
MSVSKAKSKFLLFGWKLKIASVFISIGCSYRNIVNAQIIPDRSLPSNSTVTVDGNTAEINGGTVRGTNLFHSFSEFSLDLDNLGSGVDTAHFNNASDITSIFSRVTGNSVSQINGLIKNNGSADLFLINPNGIIFGENAALDLGGSFITSTADSIQFDENKEFSAVDPQANPLLTVNIPVGLQYGEQAQPITVLGSGNGLSWAENGSGDRSKINWQNHTEGLNVSADETLALIGGDIFLQGGNLTASTGNIELASIAGNQTVTLNPHLTTWDFDYSGVSDLGNISLSKAASIAANGDGVGSIGLVGDSISITEGSAILSASLGEKTAGSISINARELDITGTSPYSSFNSSLYVEVAEDAVGDGSNVLIESDRLSVVEGGQIYFNTLSTGDAGDLNIRATEIEVQGVDSGLFSTVGQNAAGNGANISLDTAQLNIQNTARIQLDTFSLGNGGSLNITAEAVNITQDSKIYARAIEDIGNGGDIEIATDSLLVQESSRIYAGNFERSIVEHANSDTLNIMQASANTMAYSIIGTGQVGNIKIDANSIVLGNTNEDEFSSISTTSFANGGGIIKLNANSVSLDRGRIVTETKGSSHGGSIYLNADNLSLNNGGKISTATKAGGNAGKIVIHTGDRLFSTGKDSGILNQAQQNADGDGGQIIITGKAIEFENGSKIQSSNSSVTDSIQIEAEELNLADDTIIYSPSQASEASSDIDLNFNSSNNYQLDNAIAFSQINTIELTLASCEPNQKYATASNQISSTSSVWENISWWIERSDLSSLPSDNAVATQNLSSINSPKSTADRAIIEAQSWQVDAEGKISLLAECL